MIFQFLKSRPLPRFNVVVVVVLLVINFNVLVKSVEANTCQSLQTFYAKTSISEKRLNKFGRALKKFTNLVTAKDVNKLAKRMSKQITKCKSSSAPQSSSRIQQDISTMNSVGDFFASLRQSSEESLIKSCKNVHKLKRNAFEMKEISDALFKLLLPSYKVQAPRDLSVIVNGINDKMSVPQVYETIHEMMRAVPRDETTCDRICPCGKTVKGICRQHRMRDETGQCVEVAGSGDTRCPTMVMTDEQGECSAKNSHYIIGYTYTEKDWENAICSTKTLQFYCDPEEPFKCVGGVFQERICCMNKCLRRLCSSRRELYQSYGFIDIKTPSRCLLNSLAKDIGQNDIDQYRACRTKCTVLFS